MGDEDIRDWRRDGEDGLEASKREFEPRRGEGAAGDAGEAAPQLRSGGLSGEGGDVGGGVKTSAGPGPVGVRAQAIACPNCRYNLTGATIGMSCPECGMIVGSGMLAGSGMPTSGKAVASMVLGIVSIVGCMFYGIPAMICGPLALIFARQAKKQAERGEVNPSSAGMATAGFVCGLIGTVMGGLILVFVVGMIAVAIATSP